MHPVIVGRIFILLENKTAARFFKQAVVKCGAVAVVVELRKQHVCGLASGTVLRISGEVGVNAYLYSIAGFSLCISHWIRCTMRSCNNPTGISRLPPTWILSRSLFQAGYPRSRYTRLRCGKNLSFLRRFRLGNTGCPRPICTRHILAFGFCAPVRRLAGGIRRMPPVMIFTLRLS